jgi:hypothetical protein
LGGLGLSVPGAGRKENSLKSNHVKTGCPMRY